ncbi:MAG TPA: AAA family ATPase [Nitrososphaera sp.]|nr:AAA family ATPase [Nitrososphaera sp.]
MKLYEVFTPEIKTIVRYKVLSPEEVESFVKENRLLGREDYVRLVLENVIFNLKSEVTVSLKKMNKDKAGLALDSLFNGCVMLNPGLDIDIWIKLASSSLAPPAIEQPPQINTTTKRRPNRRTSPKSRKVTKTKFLNLERHLKERIIGQDHAIEEVTQALKRSITGLGDEGRPLGVFLFAGASGIGKTHLARELHQYLFGEYDIVRIDCGEYQHKHENQKLLGAPPGYLGHDEGGQLSNALLERPQTVVLLDEVEKAHPDIWNTFLRVFDEGALTDSAGKKVNFKDSIIIMTTNLGNGQIVDDMLNPGMGFGSKALRITPEMAKAPNRERTERTTREEIRKNFRPEFLNRIDRVIVFNNLDKESMMRVADIELSVVAEKLEKKGFNLTWDPSSAEALVEGGTNPVQGARGLSQYRRDQVENKLADLILHSRLPRGTVFHLYHDGEFQISTSRPVVRSAIAVEAK